MGILDRDGRPIAYVLTVPVSVHVGMYYEMLAQVSLS